MKLTEVATERLEDNITSITPGALKGGLQAVDRHPTKDELLCGGADGVPKLYQMYRTKARVIGDDFNLIRAFSPPMPGRIFAARFSPDGSRAIFGSSSDGKGEVHVYETATGKLVSTLQGIQGRFMRWRTIRRKRSWRRRALTGSCICTTLITAR